MAEVVAYAADQKGVKVRSSEFKQTLKFCAQCYSFFDESGQRIATVQALFVDPQVIYLTTATKIANPAEIVSESKGRNVSTTVDARYIATNAFCGPQLAMWEDEVMLPALEGRRGDKCRYDFAGIGHGGEGVFLALFMDGLCPKDLA